VNGELEIELADPVKSPTRVLVQRARDILVAGQRRQRNNLLKVSLRARGGHAIGLKLVVEGTCATTKSTYVKSLDGVLVDYADMVYRLPCLLEKSEDAYMDLLYTGMHNFEIMRALIRKDKNAILDREDWSVIIYRAVHDYLFDTLREDRANGTPFGSTSGIFVGGTYEQGRAAGGLRCNVKPLKQDNKCPTLAMKERRKLFGDVYIDKFERLRTLFEQRGKLAFTRGIWGNMGVVLIDTHLPACTERVVKRDGLDRPMVDKHGELYVELQNWAFEKMAGILGYRVIDLADFYEYGDLNVELLHATVTEYFLAAIRGE
jgi:hypothetical protein